jgi:hypothetical protein
MVEGAAAAKIHPIEPKVHPLDEKPDARTVREFLPWHEVERKLKHPRPIEVELHDGSTPPAAPSGVRVSDSGVSIKAASNTNDSEGALSYRVYTVAELDRMAAQNAPSIRASMLSISASQRPPPSVLWKSAGRSFYTLLDATAGWLVLRGSKSPFREAIAHPLGAFRADLRSAIAAIDWKKTGIGLGAGLAAMAALLAIVLVVADLTDEMKPARAMSGASTTTSSAALTNAPGAPTTTPVTAAPQTAAPAIPPTTMELGDEPAPAPVPPPAPAAKTARARAGTKKGPAKKAVEDFIP